MFLMFVLARQIHRQRMTEIPAMMKRQKIQEKLSAAGVLFTCMFHLFLCL